MKASFESRGGVVAPTPFICPGAESLQKGKQTLDCSIKLLK